jgi:glutamine synthetase
MLNIPLSVSFYNKHSYSSRIYNSYILEYIWIDGGGNLRSKYRTAYPSFHSADACIAVEDWNCDDSAHANDANAPPVLVPIAHFFNPFFDPGRAFLILCDAYLGDGIPADTNFRCDAVKVFEKGRGRQIDPWFSIEQEYFITQSLETGGAQQDEESQHYCGVGTRAIILRKLAEKHYEYCLQAGLKIGGMNAEAASNQWNFKIGPCSCIDAGDELWVARYILHKLSEEFGVYIRFKSELASASAASGTLNTTFSTEESRNKSGLKCIYNYIDRLWKKHARDSEVALVADSTSIRVPKSVLKAGCGYLEYRRTASDADPYRVIAAIFSGACFD